MRSFRGFKVLVSSLMLATVAGDVAGADVAAASGAEVAPPGMRRLSETQYRNTIADIFGPDIQINGRFDPVIRPPHGLLAGGASEIGVSPAGFESYFNMARSISAQVTDQAHRKLLIGCEPKAAQAPDDACASKFFTRVGRLLFRRPMTQGEVAEYTKIARDSAVTLQDFHLGLAAALSGMLVSHEFLFDTDIVEQAPGKPGEAVLSPYTIASRLSFLLWDSSPDDELLKAAARGDLATEQGRAKQVDRMLASPRMQNGLRSFFADMFRFEVIADVAKNPAVYPAFVSPVKAEMMEQMLRTILKQVTKENGDYRDVYVTRETFMTRALAVVYRIPAPPVGGWSEYTFPENDPRAGVATLVNFLAGFSHDGRSSPTLRGKAIRELVLCQPVPDPPGNVNFVAVDDTNNTELPTGRDRLLAHQQNPVCAGCHRITDPMGLALESFDGVGTFRATENGAPIDTSGSLDGVKFENAVGLGQALRNHARTPACLVNRLWEYSTRRRMNSGDKEYVQHLNGQFADLGYNVPKLLRSIAASDALYRVGIEPTAETKSAAR